MQYAFMNMNAYGDMAVAKEDEFIDTSLHYSNVAYIIWKKKGHFLL